MNVISNLAALSIKECQIVAGYIGGTFTAVKRDAGGADGVISYGGPEVRHEEGCPIRSWACGDCRLVRIQCRDGVLYLFVAQPPGPSRFRRRPDRTHVPTPPDVLCRAVGAQGCMLLTRTHARAGDSGSGVGLRLLSARSE